MTPEQLLNIACARPLIVVVADGMHEPPIDAIGGVTPWQAACCGSMSVMQEDTILLVPDGMEASTDVALLTLLGYDARSCSGNRAPFEALGLGLDVSADETVVRCNLVSTRNGMITSHCGNSVTNADAAKIVDILNSHFANEYLQFYVGNGFRALLKIKGLNVMPSSIPPHNILNQPYKPHLISDAALRTINLRANSLLEECGLSANGIWLWGAGKLAEFKPFAFNAASISGTQLVRGISRALGIDVIEVEGADGTLRTNLKGKCDATISALKKYDMVIVHVEACDEASHSLDTVAKISMINRIDRELVKPLLEFARCNKVSLVVSSDHGTSSVTGRHLGGQVPCYKFI